MSLPSLEINQVRWNRMLLQSFWIILIFSVILESMYLFITELPTLEFINSFIIRPTIILTLIVLLAESGVRWLPKHHDYVLIFSSLLLAITIISVHASLEYLLFILFFPIMISIFYFQFKKLLFSSLFTGIALLSLYVLNPELNNSVSFVGLCVMAFILLTYSAIAFGVLARGREIQIHLRSSYESNQELLVRTILMDKLAKTDALTDTYNHMAYHEFKDHLVEQAENGHMSLHLAILDIDNFKSVNDTYGHRAGDVVLKKVAEIARSKAGSNDIVARYGGEEFALLFTENTTDEVYNLVEDIRIGIASTTHEALEWRNVTISIGLNLYTPGMGKESFFHGADSALYEAKNSGKNRTKLATTLKWNPHSII